MRSKRNFKPWTWARRLCAASFLALLWLGTREQFPWLKGSLGGTKVLDTVPFVDPLAALEVTLASGSWMGEMWFGAGLLLLLALIAGPIFCGWLCPLGLLLDLSGGVRRFAERRLPRVSLPNGRLPHGLKYFVLGAALSFSYFSGLPLFQAFSPVQGLVRALLFGTQAVLWVVLALVLIESFAPRLWCRSLCPLGALYCLIGRFGVLRIRIDPDRAGEIKCQRCEAGCPMGIAVMGDFTLTGKSSLDHPDCNRCGACTEFCPNSVLHMGVRNIQPGTRERRAPKRPKTSEPECPQAQAAVNLDPPVAQGSHRD